jgi:hypothetical protein
VEFSWKKNLMKAGVAALAAGLAAGALVVTDALDKGDVDPKKLALAATAACVAGIAKSLRNLYKNT